MRFPELQKITESPDPASTFVGSPGIARLASGRIVVTMDLGNQISRAVSEAVFYG